LMGRSITGASARSTRPDARPEGKDCGPQEGVEFGGLHPAAPSTTLPDTHGPLLPFTWVCVQGGEVRLRL
jgi:hypothetical protein